MAAGKTKLGAEERHRVLGDSNHRECDCSRVSWEQWRERLQDKEMEKEKCSPENRKQGWGLGDS